MKTFTLTIRDSIGGRVLLHIETDNSAVDTADSIQGVYGGVFRDLGCALMNTELYSEVPY